MNIDLKAIREFAWESIRHGRSHLLPPQTVIALLDRLEAAEKDAARMRDELRRSESLIEQYREEAAHRENPDDYVMQY